MKALVGPPPTRVGETPRALTPDERLIVDLYDALAALLTVSRDHRELHDGPGCALCSMGHHAVDLLTRGAARRRALRP